VKYFLAHGVLATT
jgi:hypothetical protein